MAVKPAIKGTPEERRELRKQVRDVNRDQFFRQAAQAASNGRERLVSACRFAQAVSAHLTDSGRYRLAQEIVRAVERVNVPANRKESR